MNCAPTSEPYRETPSGGLRPTLASRRFPIWQSPSVNQERDFAHSCPTFLVGRHREMMDRQMSYVGDFQFRGWDLSNDCARGVAS